MDDMMSRLQDILSDEESMNQIKKLANMMGNNNENDEESPDISSILGSINNNNSDENTNQDNDKLNFDISKIMKIQEILSHANKKDQNTEFLHALKPLLKNDNQMKIDRISKILKLLAIWPLIKESGILGGDLFDFL